MHPIKKKCEKGQPSVCLHVLTHFPYLWNGWTHCAEIGCVVAGKETTSYAFYASRWQGTSARAQVSTPFPVLENDWTLEYGVQLGTHLLRT